MELSFTELVGMLAATLTTIAFVPQAILALRSRSTAGLSVTMYALFTVGIFCWLTYGVLLGSWPMIVANLITFLLACAILIATVRNRQRQRTNTDEDT